MDSTMDSRIVRIGVIELITGKEYLACVYSKEKDIIVQQEYIDALRSTLELSGVTLGERVQSSGDMDRMGKVFAQIDIEERRLERMRQNFIDYKIEVMNAIRQVEDDRYRTLLHEKYINYKQFKDIAGIMNYSYDYVIELHKGALDYFNEFIQSNPIVNQLNPMFSIY